MGDYVYSCLSTFVKLLNEKNIEKIIYGKCGVSFDSDDICVMPYFDNA